MEMSVAKVIDSRAVLLCHVCRFHSQYVNLFIQHQCREQLASQAHSFNDANSNEPMSYRLACAHCEYTTSKAHKLRKHLLRMHCVDDEKMGPVSSTSSLTGVGQQQPASTSDDTEDLCDMHPSPQRVTAAASESVSDGTQQETHRERLPCAQCSFTTKSTRKLAKHTEKSGHAVHREHEHTHKQTEVQHEDKQDLPRSMHYNEGLSSYECVLCGFRSSKHRKAIQHVECSQAGGHSDSDWLSSTVALNVMVQNNSKWIVTVRCNTDKGSRVVMNVAQAPVSNSTNTHPIVRSVVNQSLYTPISPIPKVPGAVVNRVRAPVSLLRQHITQPSQLQKGPGSRSDCVSVSAKELTKTLVTQITPRQNKYVQNAVSDSDQAESPESYKTANGDAGEDQPHSRLSSSGTTPDPEHILAHVQGTRRFNAKRRLHEDSDQGHAQTPMGDNTIIQAQAHKLSRLMASSASNSPSKASLMSASSSVTRTAKFSCAKCHKWFVSEFVHSTHSCQTMPRKGQQHKPTKCTHCTQLLFGKQEKNEHLLEKHAAEVSHLVCDFCDTLEIYANESNLRKHQTTKHRQQLKEEKQQNEPSESKAVPKAGNPQKKKTPTPSPRKTPKKSVLNVKKKSTKKESGPDVNNEHECSVCQLKCRSKGGLALHRKIHQ